MKLIIIKKQFHAKPDIELILQTGEVALHLRLIFFLSFDFPLFTVYA
jgi:hypothetical protein